MFKYPILSLGVFVCVFTAALPCAAPPRSNVERGKYIVEHVAMCIDCHTPRSGRGELDRNQWLHGSKLDFQPTHPMPVWADYAPGLSGLPGWKDEAVITLLSTGMTPSGTPPRPPMPHYRMTREDAAAVVAYLRSLKPATR